MGDNGWMDETESKNVRDREGKEEKQKLRAVVRKK